jgi:2-phosphoglycerate kinase
MQQEQAEIMRKVEKVNPYVMWLGAASGVLIVAIASLAAYERLTQVQ